MEIIRYQDLGHRHYGWLDARYHFSFGDYYDPRRMGFGALRVWNDDIISPHNGFAPHPHRDMDIVTYLRQGAISHQDSAGNQGRTSAGNIQVMSAGTGITHSEYNHEDETTRLFQIWFLPRHRGNKPGWENREFPAATKGWQIVASGFAEHLPQAVFIDSDAALWAGNFAAATSLTVGTDNRGRVLGRYLVVDDGEIILTNQQGAVQSLTRGDAVKLEQDEIADITCHQASRLVMAELRLDA